MKKETIDVLASVFAYRIQDVISNLASGKCFSLTEERKWAKYTIEDVLRIEKEAEQKNLRESLRKKMPKPQ